MAHIFLFVLFFATTASPQRPEYPEGFTEDSPTTDFDSLEDNTPTPSESINARIAGNNPWSLSEPETEVMQGMLPGSYSGQQNGQTWNSLMSNGGNYGHYSSQRNSDFGRSQFDNFEAMNMNSQQYSFNARNVFGSPWGPRNNYSRYLVSYLIRPECMPHVLLNQERYICTPTGNIICLVGWTGALCDIPVCPDCGEHGQCIEPGKCRCTVGYYGERCEHCIKLPGCRHGYCTKSYECICEEGWQGTNCDQAVCREGCNLKHASCKYPNECVCNPGMYGRNCSECIRAPGCVHGTCDRPFQCSCLPNWTGKNCDKPVCDKIECIHGICSMPDFCLCETGWSGKACDQCVPHPGCDKGYCIRPWDCICNQGWAGPLCNLNASDPNTQRILAAMNMPSRLSRQESSFFGDYGWTMDSGHSILVNGDDGVILQGSRRGGMIGGGGNRFGGTGMRRMGGGGSGAGWGGNENSMWNPQYPQYSPELPKGRHSTGPGQKRSNGSSNSLPFGGLASMDGYKYMPKPRMASNDSSENLRGRMSLYKKFPTPDMTNKTLKESRGNTTDEQNIIDLLYGPQSTKNQTLTRRPSSRTLVGSPTNNANLTAPIEDDYETEDEEGAKSTFDPEYEEYHRQQINTSTSNPIQKSIT